MQTLKVVVERHVDGYVAYPLGIEGVVVGQGDSFQEAINDLASAVQFHIDTFGQTVIAEEQPLDVLVGEVEVRTGAQVPG